MPRLLLINPNTTRSVTDRLTAIARERAPAGGEVESRTAAFGPAYISSETGVVLAGHAALHAWAATVEASPEARPDAVLLACFGDPGLMALRDLSEVPVIGMAQAAMEQASRMGRFAIVTGGAAWGPMLRRLAQSLDLGERLAEVVTVEQTGAQLAADPVLARTVLRAACRAALANAQQSGQHLDAVVVGGAALAGVAQDLQADVPLALVDSVQVAIDAAWAAATDPKRAGRTPAGVGATPTPWLSHPGPDQSDTDALTRVLRLRQIT